MNSVTKPQTWAEAQKWELDWHLNQQFNTLNEELKQRNYAHFMGLDRLLTNFYGIQTWDFGDKSVVDVGGGEVSMLLKSKAKKKTVIDPCNYPEWVKMRYKEAGIEFLNIKAENFNYNYVEDERFDVGLIYNCLQHTEFPELILKNMRERCNVIHIFEWVNSGISEGHIHDLQPDLLDKWLGGIGKTEYINANPTVGNAYYGIFKGDNYKA